MVGKYDAASGWMTARCAPHGQDLPVLKITRSNCRKTTHFDKRSLLRLSLVCAVLAELLCSNLIVKLCAEWIKMTAA